MKIAAVEPIRIGSQLFVRIRTDDGLVGLGQSACWAYPDAVRGVLEDFRPFLLDQDPMRIEHHWQHLYRMGPFRGSVLGGAVSAVDIALWDIKGQTLGAPIWELLGGKCRDRIRLHLLMGGQDPQSILEAARHAAAEGFTAIKFDPIPDGYQDLSTAALVAAVIDMVAAAREAVGNEVDVILEMHRKLTPLQAIPIAEAVAQFQPLFYRGPDSDRQHLLAGRDRAPSLGRGRQRRAPAHHLGVPRAPGRGRRPVRATRRRTGRRADPLSRRSPPSRSRSMRPLSPTTSSGRC